MTVTAIDLNLLRVFDAIYRERNISRAAHSLNITQPAASNALQRLRDRLDDPLFYRASGGVAPTPVAQAMVEPVREALQLLDSCIQQNISFDPCLSHQHFRIGLNDLGEALIMPRLLQLLHIEAPHVSMQSIAVGRREMAHELISNNLDIAIDSPLVANPQISHTPLFKDSYVCLVRPGHQVLTQPWNLQTFLQLEHVHPSTRRSGHGMVDIALHKLGFSRRVTLRAQHYMVTPQIVRESDLALCVPRAFGNLFPDLVQLDIPLRVGRLELHLFQRKSAENYAAYLWLQDKIKQVIATLQFGEN